MEVIPDPEATAEAPAAASLSEWLRKARQVRSDLPRTQDSTGLLRCIRLERAGVEPRLPGSDEPPQVGS